MLAPHQIDLFIMYFMPVHMHLQYVITTIGLYCLHEGFRLLSKLKISEVSL